VSPVAKPAKPLPCILVDTREQACWQFSDRVTVQRATLSTGDYTVAGFSDRVAWERKSLTDLVGSLSQGRERFLDCCRRLRDYEHKAIIVEASVNDVLAGAYRSRMHPNSVLASVLAIHMDYGVPTIWAGDSRNAARIVEWLAVRLCTKEQPRPDTQEQLAGAPT